MNKILISTAVAAMSVFGLTATAGAAPHLAAQCDINSGPPGAGPDDSFPCVNDEVSPAIVYPAPPAAAGPTVPTLPPIVIPPDAVLPKTGSDANDPLVIGAMAAAVGAGLILVARRRRQPADAAS